MRRTVGALRTQYGRQFVYRAYNVDTPMGLRNAQAIGVTNYPVLVLIDRHGVVQKRLFGVLPPEQVAPDLEKLIAQQ